MITTTVLLIAWLLQKIFNAILFSWTIWMVLTLIGVHSLLLTALLTVFMLIKLTIHVGTA
jgi:hypothetical protein